MKTKQATTSPAQYQRRRASEISAILHRHGIMHGMTPEKLVAVLVDLGPTFVKMGQLLSMRSDFLPTEYCKALEALRTHIDPIPYEEIKAALKLAYAREPNEVFTQFDPQPLGAASIAQVHRARVGNEDVVVKVQRPNLYEMMSSDILMMKKAVRLINHTKAVGEEIDLNKVLDEIWAVTQLEIDFRHEAENLTRFAQNNAELRYVTSPKVYETLSTQKVLVMSYLGGIAINDLQELKTNGYQPNEIARKLANNYVQQVIGNGFFHADPHAGNIKIENGKIAWLDLGMMGELNPMEKEQLGRILEGFAGQDTALLLDAVLKLGTPLGDVDIGMLTQDLDAIINKYTIGSVSKIDVGSFSFDLLEAVRRNKIAFPESLSTLGRGVSSLQGVLKLLDADISLTEIILSYVSGYKTSEFNPQKELEQAAQTSQRAAKRLMKIPSQLSDTFTLLQRGQMKVKLEHSLSRSMLGELEGMVNKLVIAILAAALLTGASLVSVSELQPRALNIPIISLICYAGAILLIIRLMILSRKPKRKTQPILHFTHQKGNTSS